MAPRIQPQLPDPQHFDLGVDLLASPAEIAALPHDWENSGQHGRPCCEGHLPDNTHDLQIWAATLDVPGM